MRRVTLMVAAFAFVASVYLANWLVQHVGPVRVWPTDLLAPAGVYVVGLAFLLRDTVQRFASSLYGDRLGQAFALVCVALGAGLSALVSPRLAVASSVAFLASETVGLLVFWIGGGTRTDGRALAGAVGASSVAAAALDSYVFLMIAFGSLAFFEGQLVAKLSVSALAFPFVLAARRRYPTERTA